MTIQVLVHKRPERLMNNIPCLNHQMGLACVKSIHDRKAYFYKIIFLDILLFRVFQLSIEDTINFFIFLEKVSIVKFPK